EAAGSVRDQLATLYVARIESPKFEPGGRANFDESPKSEGVRRPNTLQFDNGLGGFSADGTEYIIHLEAGETTPAPWANVLANDEFGSIVTEAGLGFSWAINSGENRLTPWSNDPVADPQTEILYLRDEESARVWTPTPQPAGADETCQIRHGAGYTIWTQNRDGLEQELLAFVPSDDPVKIVRLRLHNSLPRPRRITATYYAEWLLGSMEAQPNSLLVTDYDAAVHAIMATNRWNSEFGERMAFLTSSRPPHSLTTSRSDFFGDKGDLDCPEALRRWDLGGRQQSATDSCGALQVHLDLTPGETADAVFVLGQGSNRAHAQKLARRWQDEGEVERALEARKRGWNEQLGAVEVSTPDAAFDLMINRWLPYQTVSSRLLARAGFYQAGGAFGFRDQLQDVLALVHSDPARIRSHILTAAAHQFEEGDVLHWWHPPFDRGVRTRCSDDLLWLPYATSSYVAATSDETILSEDVPFLQAPALAPEEKDRYARFGQTNYGRTLFEHCERALERGFIRGERGLPLIGSGDWNDGMDRVGEHGRGESIWLAWFTIATIDGFVGLCKRVGRTDLVERWVERGAALKRAVEDSGWDGNWYLRAIDDEGRPWGSASNDECQIDSIAQSWAVLSGAGDPERSRSAMMAAMRHLVRDDDQLVRLLTPPFDLTPRDPGYIKAYPPGIRENGGQYTHAAAWLGIAQTKLRNGDGAIEIFNRINPINHTYSSDACIRYLTEPYALAGDVAGSAPHTGRGGWSWYTGAAAWTWRLGVEHILGLRLVEGRLVIDPCLPKSWKSFSATISRPTGSLNITVEDPEGLGTGKVSIEMDGEQLTVESVAFPDDGSIHEVIVRIWPIPHQTNRPDRYARTDITDEIR
ncbi:MAG: cellobiose phosphorylase, partial [Sphingobium sp.]